MRSDLSRLVPDLPAIPVLAQAAHAPALIDRGSVVCVGTFDGVHRGHQAIISHGRQLAREKGLPLWILSFHPHPKSIVRPDIAPLLLTEPDERVALFAHYGADGVVMQRFDAAFASSTASQFVQSVLVDALRAEAIVVGADFGFGRDRQGTPGYLRSWGVQAGKQVAVIELLTDPETGERIGSGLIRNLLYNWQLGKALKLLDHPYPVTGEVVPGMKKGREIGYPTWNLSLSDIKLPPPVGVYAGWTSGPTPQPGMAYYGVNPTFGGKTPHLEVNVLRGSPEERSPRHPRECFWLSEFIRPEVTFANADELRRQLADDERVVRSRLGV